MLCINATIFTHLLVENLQKHPQPGYKIIFIIITYYILLYIISNYSLYIILPLKIDEPSKTALKYLLTIILHPVYNAGAFESFKGEMFST